MIENKIEKSGLVNFDLEEFYPEGPRFSIDLKDWLWEGLILKEKDFRDKLASHAWSHYKDSFVSIFCSADAIVPVWTYMLIGSKLEGNAKRYYFASPEVMEEILFIEVLKELDAEQYRDKKILVKGCSNKPVPPGAYLELTKKLAPVASSLMYGEACSTVPVYKRPRS